MEDVVRLLALTLSTTAIILIFLILFINVYLKIRRQFSIKVNCWFCNEWTKVCYDDRNSFECPTCLQYNGFTSDGDYNKLIPTQHDELLNQQRLTAKTLNKSPKTKNGLCHICNNNQQLKVYQLANFVPFNEANYDAEIEHFQKQLEKAYKLCKACESVVHNTIRQQNFLLGINISQLRKKGLLLLDLDKSYNGISKETKQKFVKRILYFTLIALACLNISFIFMEVDFSSKNLKRIIPKLAYEKITIGILTCTKTYNGILLHLTNNYIAAKKIIADALIAFPYMETTFANFNKTVNSTLLNEMFILNDFKVPFVFFNNSTAVCLCGGVIQLLMLLIWRDKRELKRFVLWSFLICVNLTNISFEGFSTYANVIQFLGSVFIIKYTYSFQRRTRTGLKKLKKKEQYDWKTQNLGKEFDCTPEKISPSVQKRSPLRSDHHSRLSDTNSVFNLSCRSLSNNSTFSNNTATYNSLNKQNNSPLSSRSIFNGDDLDLSLNKLHLGTSNLRRSPSNSMGNVFYATDRSKPVISPSKFKNDTQNSWVAGGYWHGNSANRFLLSNSCHNNVSRSSSQTSGFVSHAGQNEQPGLFRSSPPSVNSYYGDLDCHSVFSEPLYCVNGTHNKNYGHYFAKLPSYTDFPRPISRNFYPVTNREQLVYFSPMCMQTCGFSKISNNEPSNNLMPNFSFGSVSTSKNLSFKDF